MTSEEAAAALKMAFREIVRDDAMIGQLSREDGQQFMGFARVKWSGKYGVMLDIPIPSMDDVQNQRCQAYFQSKGVELPTCLPCSFDGENHHIIKAWTMAFDNEEDFSRFAIEAFESTFVPPPYPEYEVSFERGIIVE